MSTTTTADKPRNDEVDPAKTAAFLANLKRSITKPDPDDQPAPKPAPAAKPAEPVMAEVEPEPTPEPEIKPIPAKKPAKRAAKKPADDGGGVSMNITLNPGTATKVVYIRVDKTLADRLQLIAFQNKISGTDGPSSINDIGIEALRDWLDNQAA